jgi:hypothetical protein
MGSLGVWIAALLTLCIYSFLYKDNPFYKFAEHLFVGVAMGYSVVLTYRDGFIPYVWKYLTAGFTGEPVKLLVIIPTLIGLLFFMRFVPRVSWLVRYPIAFSLGLGTGIGFPLALQANIYQQMYGTLSPFRSLGDLSAFQIFNAVLILVGVLSTLVYFFFSAEHKALRGVSKLGIIFLMIGFGSAFGNTVMGRISILIGRMQFLLRDWLHLL